MDPLLSPSLSELPGIGHGFFTRQGGVSGGLYASLNCGPGSRDDQEHVFANRARVAQFMGVAPERLVTQYQVHGVDVTVAEQPWKWEDSPQADALVTATPGLLLGVLTADCVPVLFADPVARVVGAAHAGWKGASGNIMEATIAAMERLGASRGSMIAAIGPAIGQASYEVGPEFRERFLVMDPAYAAFFTSPSGDGKSHFDIQGFVAASLRKSRVSAVNLLANDTCIEQDRFFSYRRSTLRKEPDYGRQVSVIMLR